MPELKLRHVVRHVVRHALVTNHVSRGLHSLKKTFLVLVNAEYIKGGESDCGSDLVVGDRRCFAADSMASIQFFFFDRFNGLRPGG